MVKKTAKETGQTLLEDYKIIDKGRNQEGRANVNMKREKGEQTKELEKSEAKKKEK